MDKVKLRVTSLFSGVGFQEMGAEACGCFDVEKVACCEMYHPSLIAFAAVHYGMSQDVVNNYPNYPSREDMAAYLDKLNMGYDFVKDKPFEWTRFIKRKGIDILNKTWLACHLTHNLGDIMRVEHLPPSDLVTYSFPCTDISLAGKQAGLTGRTRSGLVAEVLRLVGVEAPEDRPKYLLMENVANLVYGFKDDFLGLLEDLSDLGYNTYYEVLDSSKCGGAQRRERVFAWSIRKDIDKQMYTFPKPFKSTLRLCDIMERDVPDSFTVKDRPELEALKQRCYESGFLKSPNVRARYLTPLEQFRLMGATDAVAEKVVEIGTSLVNCQHIAGNGLVGGTDRTNGCISLMMQHLYKAQYDPEYVCYDEEMSNGSQMALAELDKSLSDEMSAKERENALWDSDVDEVDEECSLLDWFSIGDELPRNILYLGNPLRERKSKLRSRFGMPVYSCRGLSPTLTAQGSGIVVLEDFPDE